MAIIVTETPGHGGIGTAGFHRLSEDRIDHQREADHFGRNVFDHPLQVVVAGSAALCIRPMRATET